MESFLKNRPVHTIGVPPGVETPAPDDGASGKLSGAAKTPFVPLHRAAVVGAPPAADGAAATPEGAAVAEVDAGCSAEGATVRAVVERGRVTRIVVTCSCGKVTEVACEY